MLFKVSQGPNPPTQALSSLSGKERVWEEIRKKQKSTQVPKMATMKDMENRAYLLIAYGRRGGLELPRGECGRWTVGLKDLKA
jgi:hypothetical protein